MDLEDVPSGSVVVGVDDVDAARHALLWAVDQAQAEARALIVVHAAGPGAQEGRRILDEACAQARRRAPGLEVHGLLGAEDPRDLLIALSRRAAVLVVGSRTEGPVARRLLGSVSVAVVRHATCPVVVVPPGNQPVERAGILLGVDTWDRSSGLLDFAYRQASQRRLPLTLLHAHLPTRPGTGPEETEERLHMADVVTEMRKDYPDITVRCDRVPGPPAELLVQESAGMGLVVVGTPAGGPASELLFGSIAAFVVDHATCPVAVVPVGEHG